MKRFFAFLRQTILAGFLVLVPILIVVYLFEKVWRILKEPIEREMALLGLDHALVAVIVTAIALIAICFATGLLMRFPVGKGFGNWLEENLLRFVPGYQYFRMMLGEKFGDRKDDSIVVLAEIDGWQPALLVEEIPDGRCVVYVPGVPNTTSGSVHVVAADAVRHLDAPLTAVMKSLRYYGKGMAKIASAPEPPRRA